MSEPDFRKGDKVWVEVVIVDPKYIASTKMLVHKIDGGNCIWIDKKDVKKHIPTSKPLEVGCIVKYLHSPYFVDYVGKVIAINDDLAWVHWDLNREYSGGNTVAYLKDLKRIL